MSNLVILAAHQGFMDGVANKFPNIKYNKNIEYELGYMYGAEHSKETSLSDFDMPDLKKGDFVTIPKGTKVHSTKNGYKTYKRSVKIKLHDIYSSVPAYVDHGKFVPPTPPLLLWVGAGGYWCTADVNCLK